MSTAPQGLVPIAGAPAHVVRDWARLHGFEIGDGGAISGEVLQAYDAAVEGLRPPSRPAKPSAMDHLPARSYHRNHPFQ